MNNCNFVPFSANTNNFHLLRIYYFPGTTLNAKT